MRSTGTFLTEPVCSLIHPFLSHFTFKHLLVKKEKSSLRSYFRIRWAPVEKLDCQTGTDIADNIVNIFFWNSIRMSPETETDCLRNTRIVRHLAASTSNCSYLTWDSVCTQFFQNFLSDFRSRKWSIFKVS